MYIFVKIQLSKCVEKKFPRGVPQLISLVLIPKVQGAVVQNFNSVSFKIASESENGDVKFVVNGNDFDDLGSED